MNDSNVTVQALTEEEVEQMVNWYRQEDKSWLYCDDPAFMENQNIEAGILYWLNTEESAVVNAGIMPESNLVKVKYYTIKQDSQMIGFAIFRNGFEYFKHNSGFTIGIDITVRDGRGHGYGKAAVKLLLDTLTPHRENGLHEIYLETLSYNVPMQKVAEKLGFSKDAEKELDDTYQRGVEKHAADIAACLGHGVTADDLQKEKVKALLYKLDFDNWSRQ